MFKKRPDDTAVEKQPTAKLAAAKGQQTVKPSPRLGDPSLPPVKTKYPKGKVKKTTK